MTSHPVGFFGGAEVSNVEPNGGGGDNGLSSRLGGKDSLIIGGGDLSSRLIGGGNGSSRRLGSGGGGDLSLIALSSRGAS